MLSVGPTHRAAMRRVVARTLCGSFVVMLAMLAGTGCNVPAGAMEDATASGEGSGVVAAAPTTRDRARVEFVTLETTLFEDLVELVGETEAVRTATIVSEAPGRILSLNVEQGQTVAQGDVVLRVDLSVQEAQVDQIRAQMRQLDADIERNRALVTRGVGTAATVEQLELQRGVLEESVRQVRVGTRQATTRAPISGIVVEKLAEPGEYASPGVPVARIVDLSEVRVMVGLPEREIGWVREGMPVQVSLPALSEVRQGTLHRIGVEANRANRTFALEVRLPNSDGALRAGMRAAVLLQKQRLEDVVLVPRDALLQSLTGSEVFVLDETDHAHAREVTLGPGRSGWVIAASGLAEGDRLVVRGHRTLVNGEGADGIDQGPCCHTQYTSYLGALRPEEATATPTTPTP